ncbi:O-antigen polymerase [Citricoccus nitrophenolicus]|uniref:O-antigen polymerase n=1 Tax=Citricoccus nitrophenolicus TaxID=863575 RepID=A0ABV0IJP1_9MICC
MSNLTWAATLIAVLLSLSALAYGINKRTAPLLALHNSLWAVVLALVGSDLIQYHSASTIAWLTLFIGLTFFNLGAMFAAPNRKPPFPASAIAVESSPALMTRPTFFALFVIYACAFGYYLSVIATRYGLNTLISDPESIRGSEGESYLAMIPFGIRLLLYIGPFLIAVLGTKRAIVRPFSGTFRLFSLAILAVSMMLLLQRTNLFMGVLLLISLQLTAPRQSNNRLSLRGVSNAKKIIALLSAGVILLVSFQVIAAAFARSGGGPSDSNPAVSSTLRESGLYSPFHYATSGTAGFLGLVDSTNDDWPPEPKFGYLLLGDHNPQTWGAATFAPVLKAVPIAEPWDAITPFIDVGVLTNVFTWHEHFYRDFRQPGLAIAMLLYGFVAGMLFRNRFNTIRAYWLNAAVMTTVIFSPFAPKIGDTLFLTFVVVILILTTTPFRRRVHHVTEGQPISQETEFGVRRSPVAQTAERR